MKIVVVAVENNLMSVGARRIAAEIRRHNPDTVFHHIPVLNSRSFKEIFLMREPQDLDSRDEVHRMAAPLADADIVAFSSFSEMAPHTKAIIAELRRISPRTFIMWGGIHPIIDPEDAIPHVDALCTGEGEFAFAEFFEAYRNGRDYTGTRNFAFQRRGRITRNPQRPLMTSAEMDTLPLPVYGDGEYVYRPTSGTYTPLTRKDHVAYTGISYQTVWSIGCPFRCTYCGNTRFLDNDKVYAKIRHPSPEWMAREINAARAAHPYISSVVFHDDSFLGLPLRDLEEFAAVYKEQVGLPFCVLGVIPTYVKREKIEVLLEAGLNRVRMGIQSGSDRVLRFYKRPGTRRRIHDAARILADYSRHTIAPSYDLIVDNPIETRADIVETLELAYELPRPYTFNLFSLRVIPNTELARQVEELDVAVRGQHEKNYRRLTPTLANCLLLLLACVRPPRRLFSRWLRMVRGAGDDQPLYPKLMSLLRLLFLSRQAWNHLRFMDFSVIPGRVSWLAWRIGLVHFWSRWMVPKFRRGAARRRFWAPGTTTATTAGQKCPPQSWKRVSNNEPAG